MITMKTYTPIYDTDESQTFKGWCLSWLSGLINDSEAWDSKNYILTIPESHAEEVTDAEGNTILLEGPVIQIKTVDLADIEIRPLITELIIPDTVTSITGYNTYGSFDKCKNLIRVTLGAGLKELNPKTFSECLKLTEVINKSKQLSLESRQSETPFYSRVLGTHLRSIVNNSEDNDAEESHIQVVALGDIETDPTCDRVFFYQPEAGSDKPCILVNYFVPSLISLRDPPDYEYQINIPLLDSITCMHIGSYAFCEMVPQGTKVWLTLNESITYIEKAAFDSEVYWKVLIADANPALSLEQWCAITFEAPSSNPICHGQLICSHQDTKLNLVFPESVTEIKSFSFINQTIASITWPEALCAIGDQAFYGCNFVTSDNTDFILNLPETLLINPNSSEIGLGLRAFAYPLSETDQTEEALDGLAGIEIPDSMVSGWASLTWHNIFEGRTKIRTVRAPAEAFTVIPKAALKTVTITAGPLYEDFFEVADKPLHSLAITQVVLPEGLTEIPARAFINAFRNAAISIKVPSSVQIIGEEAFCDCSALSALSAPNLLDQASSLRKVGAGAFERTGYDPLKTLYLGTNLIWAKPEEGETEFGIQEKTTLIADKAFTSCASLKIIKVPSSVQIIGEGAFYGCSALEELYLPFVGGTRSTDSSKQVEQNLFGYVFGKEWFENTVSCSQTFASKSDSISYYIPTNLKIVHITTAKKGTSLTKPAAICYGAFGNCNTLTKVSFDGYGYVKIMHRAFADCVGLETLELPTTIVQLGGPVFTGSTNLREVYFAGTEMQWCQIVFSEALSNPLVHGAKLFLNGSTEEYVTSLTFTATEDTPVYIFPYAFRSYKWLQNLTIILDKPTSIIIGVEAFKNCDALQVVRCSQGLAAWNDIRVYKKMTKASATKITCKELQSELAAIPLTNKALQLAWGGDSYEDLVSIEIAQDAAGTVHLGGNNHPLEALTEPLKAGLFAYCTSIKQLSINASYVNFFKNLVTGCPSLESITVTPTNSKYNVWNNVLYNKDFSQLILAPASLREPSTYKGQKTDFVRIFTCHPNTKEILKEACRGTKFYTVRLFGALEYIHENAFEDATFLREIRLGDSVKSIGKKAFANCYSVETLALGNGLEEIATKAFENCIMLNMLRLPRNLQAIYGQAFAGCTNLTTVKYSTQETKFFKYLNGAFVPVERDEDFDELQDFIKVGNSTEALYGLYGNQFGVNIVNEGDE